MEFLHVSWGVPKQKVIRAWEFFFIYVNWIFVHLFINQIKHESKESTSLAIGEYSLQSETDKQAIF